MADVAKQVITSEQCCVLTSGGYMNYYLNSRVGVWLKLANGWEDKQNLLEGRENGGSSKLTLVWAERSIYHLELILGSIWTKVDHLWLQMVDLIEKCTEMVLTPELVSSVAGAEQPKHAQV